MQQEDEVKEPEQQQREECSRQVVRSELQACSNVGWKAVAVPAPQRWKTAGGTAGRRLGQPEPAQGQASWRQPIQARPSCGQESSRRPGQAVLGWVAVRPGWARAGTGAGAGIALDSMGAIVSALRAAHGCAGGPSGTLA